MTRRWPTGLRARIVATTTLVTLLGMVVLVGVVWLVLDRAVAANARSALADRTSTIEAGLTIEGSHVSVDPSAARDAVVWVYTSDGTQVYGPSGGELDSEAAGLAAAAPQGPTEWHDWLLQADLIDSGKHVLVVGLPIGGYESTKHLAALVTGVVGIVVVGATTGLTAWASRRSLAPVAGMARNAAAWSAADLERRFDLGEPRDEITELGAVLDGLLDRAAQAIRSEQRLTAELAHEIRSPLTVIRGQAELAALDASVGSDQGDRLQAIVAATDSLTQVVETLLAISRGEQVVDASSPVDAAVATAVQLVAVPAGIAIDVTGAPGVLVAAPQAMVSQALAPLVTNALQHAVAHVRIRVARTHDVVTIHVEDDGPGVDPADHDAVFEPGWHGATSSGTGLGLPLARRVARLAGGDVTLESARPARFVLTLPLRREIAP